MCTTHRLDRGMEMWKHNMSFDVVYYTCCHRLPGFCSLTAVLDL